MRGFQVALGLSCAAALACACGKPGAANAGAGGAETSTAVGAAGDRGAGIGGRAVAGGGAIASAAGAGGGGAGRAADDAGAGGALESPPACAVLPDVVKPVFEQLGDLAPGVERPAGYETVPESLSFDGNAIAGASTTAGENQHAYVWTHAAGMKDLKTDANGLSDALFTNCDGSVVIATDEQGEAFRLAVGQPPLKLLPGTAGGAEIWIRASDASGQVVVGVTGGEADASAERWVGSSAKGIPLGVHGYATDVSADGSVIVGVRYVGAQVASVFRWTAAAGAVDLAPATDRLAHVSADGTSVLALHPNGLPFRWRQQGVTELPCGQGRSACTPDLINQDGSVIVLSGPAPDYETLVWSEANGTVAFNAAVKAAGTSLGAWTSLNIVDMSADARVFTGIAFGPDDSTTATYRLQVPAGTF